jgi:hypothetical protein
MTYTHSLPEGWECNPAGKLEVVKMDRGPLDNAVQKLLGNYVDADIRATKGIYTSTNYFTQANAVTPEQFVNRVNEHWPHAVIDGEIVEERKAITSE